MLLLSSCTITGAGSSNTVVSGNDITRILKVNIPSGTFIIQDLAIVHGSAALNASGILIDSSTFSGDTVVNRTLFDNNKGSAGLGINNGVNLTVTDSTFTNNKEAIDSSAYDSEVITNSTFASNIGNVAVGFGSASITLKNCTFSGNNVVVEVINLGSDVGSAAILNNVTVGPFAGNPIVLRVGGGRTTTISNTILSGPCNNQGTLVSAGYNIETGTSCTFTSTGDQQNIDPLLLALADNGGFTQTMAINSMSPAYNSGNPATPSGTPPACETIDQRDISRPKSIACDIGAFELVVPTSTPTATATRTPTARKRGKHSHIHSLELSLYDGVAEVPQNADLCMHENYATKEIDECRCVLFMKRESTVNSLDIRCPDGAIKQITVIP